jgi:hypothetical protein
VKAQIPRERYGGAIGEAFTPNPSSLLNGIFAHLTKKCGGNVHERKIVNVTASTIVNSAGPRLGPNGPVLEGGRHQPQNVVDLNANTAFNSGQGADQWIAFNFLKHRVLLSHYAIRTYYPAYSSGDSPQSWVIEVSDDGKEWTEVDRRTGNMELRDRDNTNLFEVGVQKEASQVRLRQTGPNHQGGTNLCLAGLEMFGNLFETETK